MTNKNRIRANNAEITECIRLANELPDAGSGGGGGGAEAPPTQEKTVSIVKNGSTEILPDDGYVLSKVVANVDVPIPSGYIKPSGTLDIYSNGNHDVAAYESVEVDVPIPDGYIVPSGTLEVTENGSHDVTDKATVEVNVPTPEPFVVPLSVTQNGTYTPPDGVDGYSPVTVNVEPSGGGEGDNEEIEALLGIIKNTVTDFESDKITELSQYAFAYRTELKTLSLPNLKTSNTRAFTNCNSLVSLSIPNMTGYTYQYMAAYCSAMTTADVKNASYVSSYSFYGCSALTKIEFNRVGTIATNAFNGCTKLATLILRTGSVVSLGGTNAFTGTKIAGSGGYVYVPKTLDDGSDGVAAYEAASNWSTYAGKFRAIEDYPDITGG